MDIVEQTLSRPGGFSCRRMKFGDIENLYARFGTEAPNLCFAGHTDVVPVGDAASWSQGAFDAEIVDGLLIGRGAVDMKSAIAAFAAAAETATSRPTGQVAGSLLPDHRRRGGRGHPRHLDGGRGAGHRRRGDHPLRGRRTDLVGGLRRHDQGRPPGLDQCRDHGRRRAGPRGLSPARRQSRPGAAGPATAPAGASAGRRLSGVPAVQPGDHSDRRAQYRHQRHSRRRQGPAQHPLQPQPYRRGPGRAGSKARRSRKAETFPARSRSSRRSAARPS